ncbi:MAG: hypothetical protein ABJA02_16900, partial [Acidobacteriota bacterium]
MNEILLAFSASVPAVLGLGFVLGLKHATEADHLAAVATVVSDRKSVWNSMLVGGLWGAGHTISLFVAAILVLVLEFQISERTERLLETCVGIMLTLLGLNVIRKLISGGRLHFHPHTHGESEHVHPHIHASETAAAAAEPHTHHGLSLSPRSLFIGMVHGMAGSAALMLLVIPTIGSKTVGLIYVLVFGIGSIGGMMLMSLFMGLPFRITALKFDRVNHILQGIAGVFSVALGLWIVYEKAFTEG